MFDAIFGRLFAPIPGKNEAVAVLIEPTPPAAPHIGAAARIRRRLVTLWVAIERSGARASRGEARLWKVWWLAGIPVAWLTSALVLTAEHLRALGTWGWGWGDACDVARFLVYLLWFELAWRCSRNVRGTAWTPLARAALTAGLVLSAVF